MNFPQFCMLLTITFASLIFILGCFFLLVFLVIQEIWMRVAVALCFIKLAAFFGNNIFNNRSNNTVHLPVYLGKFPIVKMILFILPRLHLLPIYEEEIYGYVDGPLGASKWSFSPRWLPKVCINDYAYI